MKKKTKTNNKMTEININISLEDNRWSQDIANIGTVIEKVKQAVFSYVCNQEDIAVLQSSKPLNINLCLSDDNQVQKLNKEFRGLDKPTNVLSFANLDFDNFEVENEPYEQIELGDIIIAYETMVKEAKLENISLHDHFCHLLTHGILHILGFDHIEDDEAAYMEGFEIAILANLDIPNPYEEKE